MSGHRNTGPAVVVGTDGSASATEAVKRAAELALLREAGLHIVNAYRRASRTETLQAQAAFQRELGYAQMGRFQIDGIGDHHAIALATLEDAAHVVEHPNLQIFLHAVNADPHKALRWVAQEKEALLIVVGNKPVRSLLHPLRRSVHEELQASAPCPIRVVDTSPWWESGRPGLRLGNRQIAGA